MEKIWLKNYPPNVPAEINPDVYQSIPALFSILCEQFKDRPAFYNLGTTITYAQLNQYATHFAAFLQQELELKKGCRFAIMLPNCLQYPIALLGAFKAGLIVVNVNPLYTPDELVHQLNNAEVDAILIISQFASVLEKASPKLNRLKHVIVTELPDLFSPIKSFVINILLKYVYRSIPPWHIPHAIAFKKAIREGRKHSLEPVEISNEEIAFLQYTGGTTGVAKGAMLTHRNILANLQQIDVWLKSVLADKDEIIITALPLYHIFSLTSNCIFFSKVGGLNVLITNPRDIPRMIKEMKKFKFTAITGVNTLFNALLKNTHFKELDFSRLHLAVGGGAPVQEAVANKWEQITKGPLLEAYGLTETSPCVTINPTNLKHFNGTIGLPVPSTDILILDEDRKEMPIGSAGELAVKGPQVSIGYWHNEAETAHAFTKDGWFLTGDIASINEAGFVRILERKKDMILVSGFNVYPNEIEDVIAKFPGVLEVAVVGIHDENSGEVPKAFIVTDGQTIEPKQIIQYCREHLTPYKIPKQVEFIKSLPKTPVGKILRRALKELSV